MGREVKAKVFLAVHAASYAADSLSFMSQQERTCRRDKKKTAKYTLHVPSNSLVFTSKCNFIYHMIKRFLHHCDTISLLVHSAAWAWVFTVRSIIVCIHLALNICTVFRSFINIWAEEQGSLNSTFWNARYAILTVVLFVRRKLTIG